MRIISWRTRRAGHAVDVVDDAEDEEDAAE
jgi:hypothetical protein